MKRLMPILALAALSLALGVSAAFGCDGHAQATGDTAKAGCVKSTVAASPCAAGRVVLASLDSTAGCAKAKAAAGGAAGCCAKGKAAAATTTSDEATQSACAKAHAAAQAKLTSDGGGCAKSKAAAEAKLASGEKSAGCCAKSKAAAEAKLASDESGCAKSKAAAAKLAAAEGCKHPRTGTASLQGTVACAMCDMSVTAGCVPVLQTTTGCTLPLAPGETVEALRAQAGHGSQVVRVRGRIDADGVLAVNSFRIVGAPETATGL